MSSPSYRVLRLASGYDLAAFDCGEPSYNRWLREYADSSVRSGVCAVYLLVEDVSGRTRVVGYYAISPAQVLRAEVPVRLGRGWPESVPAWRLGKLAIHVELRADPAMEWGRQLLRAALETIVTVANIGGGKVIVVEADHIGLLAFYTRNGFKSTGADGDLSLYLKVSTARSYLTT